MAALLVKRLGGTAFTWGGASLGSASEVRTRYLVALRQADAHDVPTVVEFACS